MLGWKDGTRRDWRWGGRSSGKLKNPGKEFFHVWAFPQYRWGVKDFHARWSSSYYHCYLPSTINRCSDLIIKQVKLAATREYVIEKSEEGIRISSRYNVHIITECENG